MTDRETAFDLDRPVLDQRGFWFANDGYDKPVLATRALGLGARPAYAFGQTDQP